MPMNEFNAPHYVYELYRTSPGRGPRRYIGVRTAQNGDPANDNYWSSSKKVIAEIAAGATFSKSIVQTFSTREEAEFCEADLHWQLMVGKDPSFYNEFSQLIPGKVNQLFPRARFVSKSGEHRWFIPGAEPSGWTCDPALWAQFEDMSHTEQFSSSWRYTFKGLELPEWRFHKEYPEEFAFSVDEPRLCYSTHVKIDEHHRVTGCTFFITGHPPTGWVEGFAPSFSWLRNRHDTSKFLPPYWKRYRLESSLYAADGDCSQDAYFPSGLQPFGWIDAKTYEVNLAKIANDRKIRETELSIFIHEIRKIFNSCSDLQEVERRLQALKSAEHRRYSDSEWAIALATSGLSNKDIWLARNTFIEGSNNLRTPRRAPSTEEAHVSAMLAEAKHLYETAINELHSSNDAPVQRLYSALKLLNDAELLAEDSLSYFENEAMRAAMKKLHQEQGQIKAMIGQLEAADPRSSSLPFLLIGLVLIFILAVSF